MASSIFLRGIPAFWYVLDDLQQEGHDGPAVVKAEAVHGLVR